MRITHICVNGPVTDGWNYQDNLLTKYHKLIGHEVTIITSKWVWGKDGLLQRDERTNYVNENGIVVIRLEMFGKDDLNRKFKRFKELYTSIDESRPDILFIHGVSFLDINLIVKYVKKHNNITIYADNHADLSNSGTNWISRNILHKIIWRHYAKKLIPYTKWFYGVLPIRVDFLVDIYKLPKEKCKLLVLGADDELVKKASSMNNRNMIRSKYGIKDDDFLIMSGGKIDLYKTQTITLMKSVKSLKNDKIKLIVFGSVANELKEQVNSLVDDDKVKFIGWVDAKDTYNYFASADLVVFPGRHSVMWEQVVAQGIPMIVKDWPGTHHVDLGGNVDFLFNDGEDEIKEKIKSIIYDEKKYKMMKQIAVDKGMKYFSYYEIAKRSIQ